MEAAISGANVKKEAVNNGLIWAAINIAIFLVTYYVKPDLMGSFIWGILQFLIGIGLAVYFCIDLRKKAGGYWTFKAALTNIFIMFLVPALIVFFFTVVFAKYIEPQYAVKMKEIMSNTASKMLENSGMDQEKMDEILAKNEETFEKQLNPGFSEILMGLGMIVIMYFVGALIFAAIFKKEPPLFAQRTEE